MEILLRHSFSYIYIWVVGRYVCAVFSSFPYLTFNFYHYVVSLTYSTQAIYAQRVLSLGLKTLHVADPLQEM